MLNRSGSIDVHLCKVELVALARTVFSANFCRHPQLACDSGVQFKALNELGVCHLAVAVSVENFEYAGNLQRRQARNGALCQ